jgi:protein phosphatase
MANGALFAVADGMGGHRGGEVASDIAAGHFRIQEAVATIEELTEAVSEANALIRARAAIDPSLNGMGTTMVALARIPSDDVELQLGAANVGDSRMYRLQDGELEQLTQDHSLVAELARAGQITEKDAAKHPQRNVLTRALGVDDSVAVDSWVFAGEIGQRYLLCSDGLINEVSDQEIGAVMRNVEEPAEVATKLVDMANWSGGRDNTTVLVVDVVDAAECDPAETES